MLTGKTWRGQEPWLPRGDTDPPRAIGQVITSISRSLCDTGLLYEKTRLQLVYLPLGGQGVFSTSKRTWARQDSAKNWEQGEAFPYI